MTDRGCGRPSSSHASNWVTVRLGVTRETVIRTPLPAGRPSASTSRGESKSGAKAPNVLSAVCQPKVASKTGSPIKQPGLPSPTENRSFRYWRKAGLEKPRRLTVARARVANSGKRSRNRRLEVVLDSWVSFRFLGSLNGDLGQLHQSVDAHADLESLAVRLLEPDWIEVPDLLESQTTAGFAPPLATG